jgi:hypothetical protein
MFINLKEGKLTLYDLVVSEKMQPVLERISYEGAKEHHSFTAIHWCREGRRTDNTIVRNMHWKKTGRVIEYNDFYSQDEDEYLINYDLYKLPNIYMIIEKLLKENYEMLDALSKYQRESIGNNAEMEIFRKYKKEIYNYIYLRKILELDPSSGLELIKILKSNSKGKLKDNLKNINEYLNIYSLNLDGIKVKEKVNGK